MSGAMGSLCEDARECAGGACLHWAPSAVLPATASVDTPCQVNMSANLTEAWKVSIEVIPTKTGTITIRDSASRFC